jgi:23S rRNA (adenine2503-C2)-methyltransferase
MLMFRDVIANSGIVVAIRHSRGDDQMAACGQLGSVGLEQAPKLRVPSQFQSALAKC